MHPDGKGHFAGTSGYDTLLLMCRPMKRVYVGTVLIPGNYAPRDLSLRMDREASTKYMQYLVPDPLLSKFMTDVYEAVAQKQNFMSWPSGAQIDISSLELTSWESLSTPSSKNDAKERENARWREMILPNLQYETPQVQATTVDVIINKVRVQDKPAHKPAKGRALSVSLRKSAGRKDGKNLSQPYHRRDFDALFVFVPGNRYFFHKKMLRILPLRGALRAGLRPTLFKSNGSVK